MRKSTFAGALLLGATLLFALADVAQAKEVPPDGNIPLTAEYFPDEWFLKGMALKKIQLKFSKEWESSKANCFRGTYL